MGYGSSERSTPTSTPASTPAPEERAGHERSRDLGHVTMSRPEAAADMAERRRVRRLRKAMRGHSPPPAAIPRGMPLQIYVSTRLFSALIVAALLVVLYLFLTRDAFFVNVIYVGGTRYLTSGEIFQRSEIARMHVFWVDPGAIETRLEADPAVANARVEIGWPPTLVQVSITEREPALTWEQAGQRVWVDIGGRVMQLREDLPDLVRVVVEKPSQSVNLGPCPLQGMNEVLGPGSCIARTTVAGALQFKALYPNVDEIVYDPVKGLGYHDGRGWVLWFGDGADLATKMAVMNRIVDEVFVGARRQIVELNVTDPDAPYISLAP
jgi:hypothetical protein